MKAFGILSAGFALSVAATSEWLLPRSASVLVPRQMPCSCIDIAFTTPSCRQCTLTSTSCECPVSVVLDCQSELSACSTVDEYQSQCDSVFCMSAGNGSPGTPGGDAQCESGYEVCGDGCMPEGRVCCSQHETSCPAGTTCPATGGEGVECITPETGSGDGKDQQDADADEEKEEQGSPSASESTSTPSTTPKPDSSAHGLTSQGLWSHIGLAGTVASMVFAYLF